MQKLPLQFPIFLKVHKFYSSSPLLLFLIRGSQNWILIYYKEYWSLFAEEEHQWLASGQKLNLNEFIILLPSHFHFPSGDLKSLIGLNWESAQNHILLWTSCLSTFLVQRACLRHLVLSVDPILSRPSLGTCIALYCTWGGHPLYMQTNMLQHETTTRSTTITVALACSWVSRRMDGEIHPTHPE